MGAWHCGTPASFLPNTVYESGSTPVSIGPLFALTRPIVEPSASPRKAEVLPDAVRVKYSSILKRHEVGDDAVAAVELLHRIQLIMEELRRRPADGLVHPPPEGVINECCGGRSALRDLRQMVARIPGVRIGPVPRQVAVGIIAQADAVELGLRIISVVRRCCCRPRRWSATSLPPGCSRSWSVGQPHRRCRSSCMRSTV
jgi:hypothetical protein